MRILFAPVFFVLYFIPVWTGYFITLSVFVMVPLLALAEFTDFLDGFFARRNGEVSDFGKLFDPFADVMLHLTSFTCFLTAGVFSPVSGGYLPLCIYILIVYREFGMNFVRMIAAKKGVAIAARKGGKFKTVLYVVAEFYTLFIECLVRLGFQDTGVLVMLRRGAVILFALCLLAAYVSFIDYLVNFRAMLLADKKSEKK